MKQFCLTITISVVFSFFAFGKIDTDSIKPIRNFSFELLGNGFLYSLKYENRLVIRKLRYNIGISYLPYSLFHSEEKQQTFCFIPEVSYLFGRLSNKFEVGTGLIYRYWRNDQGNYHEYSHILYNNFRLGYRYENNNSLNVYKVSLIFFRDLTVLDSKGITIIKRKELIPWLGLSYGRRF
jgi:hypothetical protein